MATTLDSRSLSPLESFLRRYVETAGGEWDEIEPQVYDILLPDRASPDWLGTAAAGSRDSASLTVGQVSQPAIVDEEMAGRLETCPTAMSGSSYSSLGESPDGSASRSSNRAAADWPEVL